MIGTPQALFCHDRQPLFLHCAQKGKYDLEIVTALKAALTMLRGPSKYSQ